MNIFEALEKGNGKAMLFSQKGFESSYVYYESGRFFWSNEKGVYVNSQSLRGNDWIPYVPCGTCSNCGQALPPLKVKHKEIFENVKWFKNTMDIVYPMHVTPGSGVMSIFENLTTKPPMKMTLEW